MTHLPAPWVHRYYGPDYRSSVENILTPERTAAEISFLLATTGLVAPATVLDLGCGHGRHSVDFARRGFDVTGVDINEGSLALARASCADCTAATFVVGDYASPPLGPFDLVMSLFGSFGFGTDEENAGVLGEWCRRVQPGGWLVLDLWHRDLIVNQFEPQRTWRASPDLEVDEQRSLDAAASRVNIHYTYSFSDGRCTEHDVTVRLYGAGELSSLLKRGGLTTVSRYGSLRGDPYLTTSRSLVTFARKADGSPD